MRKASFSVDSLTLAEWSACPAPEGGVGGGEVGHAAATDQLERVRFRPHLARLLGFRGSEAVGAGGSLASSLRGAVRDRRGGRPGRRLGAEFCFEALRF